MQYLILASIGPVQSFIASSRRTRDLWFGSTLLSNLSKVVAKTIVKEYGLESLIFPAPTTLSNPEEKSEIKVANKILALVNGSRYPVEKIGKDIKDNIDKTLDDIARDIYTAIDGKMKRDAGIYSQEQVFQRDIAEKQIQELVEYVWVALPYEGEYWLLRQRLETLVAARKNTRDFLPVGWGSDRPKSSIDGQLESVILEPNPPRRGNRHIEAEKKDKEQRVRLRYNYFRAGPSERLSGVDLLKRLGRFSGSSVEFPSTSHIASIPYLTRLNTLAGPEREQAEARWKEYIQVVESVTGHRGIERIRGYASDPFLKEYDGALLFPERLVEDIQEKSTIKKVQEALKRFFESVNEGIGQRIEPNPYYAILQADGDGMGKVIDAQAKEGHIQHQQISRSLDAFAREAGKIVSDHQGALIYAGGDDVLAFVPQHRALSCAYRLKEAYKRHVGGFQNDEQPPKSSTLSVGIAIVHHLSLLQQALDVARAAETNAKKVKGKDALAITISKRGGESSTIAGKWENLYEHLQLLIDYYQADYLPKGTAYEIRTSVQRLTALSEIAEKDQKALERAQLMEAKRILRRKLFVPQQKKGDKETAKRILGELTARLGIPPEPSEQSQELANAKAIAVVPNCNTFLNELIVAQILAEAMQLAGEEKE